MSGTAFPSTVSQVDTTARFPLGYEVTLPATKGGALSVTNDSGSQVWVYVYNDSGSEIAANIAVMRKTETAYNVLIAATSTEPRRIVGVSQHAIASGSYGFVLKKGVGTVTADATVTADLGMITDGSTAGNVSHAASAGDAAYGWTLAGRTGAGTFSALIDCAG